MFFSSIRNSLSRALGRQTETNPFGGVEAQATNQTPATNTKQTPQKQDTKQAFQDISLGNDTLFK